MSLSTGVDRVAVPAVGPVAGVTKAASRLTNGSNAAASMQEPAGAAVVPRVRSEFSRLSSLRDSAHEVARSVRAADRAMDGAARAVERMKRVLESVVKQYPPFPAGSEERVRLMKQYAALRVMIERLTVPPDPEARSAPAGVPAERQDGLRDIPELAPDATDEHITATLGRLASAAGTLAARKQALQRGSPGADGGEVAAAAAESARVARELAALPLGIGGCADTRIVDLLD